MTKTNEELNSVMAKAKEQFRKGEPLFGKNGAFHFMLENFLNTALETEMDEHLAENKGNGGKYRRNGKMRKTILAEGLSDKIISLYATGQSTRDISKFIEDNYGSSISAETISHITDRIWPEIQSWRNRSLEDVYTIVRLDAINAVFLQTRNNPIWRTATKKMDHALGKQVLNRPATMHKVRRSV